MVNRKGTNKVENKGIWHDIIQVCLHTYEEGRSCPLDALVWLAPCTTVLASLFRFLNFHNLNLLQLIVFLLSGHHQ